MNRYLLAIDQGTTSSRCIVFDADANIIAVDQAEHQQIFPRPGWVEHDATEIWHQVQAVTRGALDRAGLSRADVSALGITNQRETTLLWDARTGEPVGNAIVWQDTRTDQLIRDIAKTPTTRGGRPAAGYRSPPTSPGRNCAGCWIRTRNCDGGPRPGRFTSAPSTPG